VLVHCSGWTTRAVTRAVLQHANELIWNYQFIATRRKLAIDLSVSNGTVNNIFDALGYLKMCSCWDPQSLTITRLCGKMCVQICCIIMRLMVTVLCQGSSLGMKHGSITWNRRQKVIRWNGFIQIRLGRKRLRLSIQQGRPWPLFCGM